MNERLRILRERRGVTQKQLGALLNCTQQAYSLYEAGLRELPISALILLADYYNTSTDYILCRTDDADFTRG